MLVYRVEHPIHGGPYRGTDIMNEFDIGLFVQLSKYTDPRVPLSPAHDIDETVKELSHHDRAKVRRLYDSCTVSKGKPTDIIWGFANKEQMDIWFPYLCIRILKKYDYQEAVYSVPDDQCLCLKMQAGWQKRHGKLVNRQALALPERRL